MNYLNTMVNFIKGIPNKSGRFQKNFAESEKCKRKWKIFNNNSG